MLPLLSHDALANTSSTSTMSNYNDENDDDSRRTITAASGLHSSRRKSSDSSSSGSSDTLVDGLSISSCGTFISEGGDAYKCARNEFIFKKNVSKNKSKCSSSLSTDVVPFKSR